MPSASQAPNTCSEEMGTPTRMRELTHMHATFKSPEELGPEIEEGAVNQPTDPPLTFLGLEYYWWPTLSNQSK